MKEKQNVVNGKLHLTHQPSCTYSHFKRRKKSIVVFQCPLFIELNIIMADAKDESNDRNDSDGNATRSTSEASQVKV